MSSKDQSDLYLDLLESTVEGIWSVGLDGCITFVNSAAVAMFGYASAEEMLGRNSHELVHHTRSDGSPYPRAECPIFHAFQKGTSAHLENELLWRKDGTSFHADYRTTPIRRNGEITGTVTTFVDNSDRVRLDAELLATRQWLQATLRGIGDAVIATDASAESRVTFLNAIAEELTGWPLEEAKGRPVLEVFNIVHEYTREPAVNPIANVLASGKVQGLANHTALIARDGREYVIEDSAAPIVDSDLKVQGVVLVFRDVTEQKKLAHEKEEASRQVERAREELHGFFMQAPLPMCILEGPEHRFSLANPLYEAFVGRRAVGKTVLECFSLEEVAHFIPLLDRVYQTGVPCIAKEQPLSLPDADGTIKDHWINLGYHPFCGPDGAVKGILAIVEDVTDQIVARNKIAAVLEGEQKARTDAERLLARASDAERRKDEFLAVLSHELRSPLNVIGGHAELLRMVEPGTPDFAESLDAIERNTKLQTQLIGDLLDVSRIITGKLMLELTTFGAEAVVFAAADSIRFAAEAKSIRLDIRIDPDGLGTLVGDAARLQQIFWNLLSNAVKFTPRGGRVALVARRVDSLVEFSVEDSGQGITPEFLPHVFDRFHQEDASKTRQYGGLGLGLAIARHLAELHGGTVSASSAGKGAGSKFTVLLPVKPIEVEDDSTAEDQPRASGATSAADQTGQGQPLEGLRILVVDDQEDARALMSKVLRKLGAKSVEVADSGTRCLELVEALELDVLVSDIGMPEMNGLQLIQEWRHRERTRSRRPLPAVALTAYATEQDREEALRAGFQEHLTKPVKVSQLVSAIVQLVRGVDDPGKGR